MPQRLQELGNLPMEERKNVARDMLPEIQQRVADLRQRVDRFTEPPQITTPEPRVEPPVQEILDRAPRGQLAIIEQQRQEDLERTRQERESAKEERKTLTERLGQVFDRTSMEDKVRDERQAMGVQEQLTKQQQQLTKIEELSNTATQLIEQRDTAIGLIGQQGIETPFIKGQQARIAENYDRRISTTTEHLGTQTALYEAQQGQIQQALGMVDQIVDAYTYDTQMELQKATMFLDLNREELNELGSEYTQLFQESQRHWENQLEEEKSEREAVLNLMLQHHDAGITPDDSVEDAVRKSSKWLGVQPDADVRELMAQFPMAEIEESDTFTQAVNKISKLHAEQPPESPKVFGGQDTGYFTWQYNEDSQTWEPAQIVGGQTRSATIPKGYTTGTDGTLQPEPMSMVDVKRYDDMYPDAGVMPTDTREMADAKVALEYELRPYLQTIKNEGGTREDAINLLKEGLPEGEEIPAVELNIVNEVFREESGGLLGTAKEWGGTLWEHGVGTIWDWGKERVSNTMRTLMGKNPQDPWTRP